MRTFRRSAIAALVLLAGGGATTAQAAEPIMPLAQVHKGMHCTAKSVVSGTDIATFDIEIIDVVAQDPAARQPFILFRASGAAIEETGIGPGFSGSPISCPAADGTLQVAGAISEGIGAYGNKVALATPIELILGEPVVPPAETRTAPALLRRARRYATPLSVGGLSAPVAQALQAAARRTGAVIYAAPAAPIGPAFPVQPLVGGAAFSVGLASGDVTAAVLGTVAYADGDTIWGFGHPMDGAGRRSLFLQDAYVYTVIGNPIGSAESSTYKFAAPGHDVGTLTNDGASAVVGRLGALPPRFPLRIVGEDLDTKTEHVANVQIADEGALGLPTSVSALSQVGALGIGEVVSEMLHGVPVRQSGSMCVRISLRGRPKPLQFCNTYAGNVFGAGAGAALLDDFSAATNAIDTFNFGPLSIIGVQVDIKLRRSLRQAYLLRATAPQRVRRGSTVRVRVLAQRVNGAKLTRTIRVHVPAHTPLGRRRIQLDGTPGDAGGSLAGSLSDVIDLGDLSADTGADTDAENGTGPRDIAALGKVIADIHRYDGVTAAIVPLSGSSSEDGSTLTGPEAAAQKARRVYRDPELRLSGGARVNVTVVR